MDIVKPDPSKFLLPAGSRSTVYTSPDPDVADLPVVATADGRVASQWLPTPGELALLNEGVPVTLIQWTGNDALQPVCVMVGGADLRD